MLFGLAVSVVLIAWLVRSVDREQLGAQLLRTDWRWLLLSAALGPAGLLARAWRWRYLFPPESRPPGLVAAMLIGYMVNNVLPLRAGEVVRIYVVARRWGGHFWTTAATLIVERLLDSLCLVLILGVLLFLVPVPRFIEWAALVMLAVDVVAISLLVAVVAAPTRCRRLIDAVTRRWPVLEARLLRAFDTFLHGLDGIGTPAHALPLVLSTVVIWLIPAAAAWSALKAAHLHLPWLAGWVVLAFVGLGVSIPSAPGYIGVFHFAAVLATGVFGVRETDGFGYGIVFHAAQFVPVTVVGWLALLREHLSLGDATRAGRAGETAAPLR